MKLHCLTCPALDSQTTIAEQVLNKFSDVCIEICLNSFVFCSVKYGQGTGSGSVQFSSTDLLFLKIFTDGAVF